MKSITKNLSFFLIALMLVFSVGCNTSRAVKGGAAGGAVGGVIGGAIGKNNGSGTKGAIIGSVVGGAAGAVIGRYMDKQAEEIEEEVPGAQVDKVVGVDENGDSTTTGIVVTFDSGVLFGFGKYELTEASKVELERMEKVFEKYPETDITIEGHTDAVGSESSNQRLSEQRAASVADYLAELGISRERFEVTGYGETQPVASNETDEGRTANRRVEVSVRANEQLAQKAQDGTLTVPE